VKPLAAVAVLVILALVTFNRVQGPAVTSATPVLTRSADPIRVILPAEPNATTISGYVYNALVNAAKEESGSLSADLRTMSKDGALLDWIASSGSQRFASDEAAALAYPLYRVVVAADRVTITSATVELLPQYWNLGGSIAHEDGHAEINEILAKECGRFLAVDLSRSGRRGAALEAAIENALYELGNDAHGYYHTVVNGARSPRHAQAARDAAQTVVEAECVSETG
jgi:hypothetical protein